MPETTTGPAPGTRYAAGSAHYAGDVSHMVGQLVGPTTFGTYLLAVSVEYDATLDRSTVVFETPTLDDLERAQRGEHGVLTVPLDGAR